MTPRRFANEYQVGDRVAIIRARHGWYNDSVEGVVEKIESKRCVVRDAGNTRYEIDHPRDIRKVT